MIEAECVRAGLGWFRLPDRGVIAVRGGDRVRFLNGQITQDIEALAAAGPGAGGYAFVLTPQGRIVADLQLLIGEEEVWLECARSRVGPVVARLDRYLVADDVALVDESERWVRFGAEGPNAFALVPEAPALAPGHGVVAEIAGAPVQIVAAGWTGYPALQLWVETGAADAVERMLLERGLRHGLVPCSLPTLEMLRIEAGVPGEAELDEDVLPAETGALARAVSFEKGCYTGQEVVARMESRGRMAHRLVGLLRPGGSAPLPVGGTLYAGDRKVGELTSSTVSSRFGAIALGFVRSAHADPDTELRLEGETTPLVVHELPFRADEGGEEIGAAAS